MKRLFADAVIYRSYKVVKKSVIYDDEVAKEVKEVA